MPEVVELRLRICTVAGKWAMGEELTLALVECFTPNDANRIAAAEYFHGLARHLCAEGEIEQAKVATARAAELWPPIRGEMIEDEGLEAVW